MSHEIEVWKWLNSESLARQDLIHKAVSEATTSLAAELTKVIAQRDEAMVAHEVTANALHGATSALSLKLDEIAKLKAQRDALLEVVEISLMYMEAMYDVGGGSISVQNEDGSWRNVEVDLRKARDVRDAIAEPK